MTPLSDLRLLQAFIQSAHLGSFSQAGQSLGISPAGISKNVSNLEKNLGVRLFNRTTRSLSLTEEGKRFLDQASQAYAMLEQAFNSVAKADTAAQQLTGRVKLSVPNSVGQALLVPVLPKFAQMFPALQLDVDFDDHVIDFVKGGYDLVLRGGTITDSSMVSRFVRQLSMRLVASPAYLAQYGTPSHIGDLARHRLIGRRLFSGKISPWHFEQQGIASTFQPPSYHLTLSDPQAIARACEAGAGIGEVADYLAANAISEGRLQRVLPQSHVAGNYQLVLQYPHRTELAPRVRAVVDFLLEHLGQ